MIPVFRIPESKPTIRCRPTSQYGPIILSSPTSHISSSNTAYHCPTSRSCPVSHNNNREWYCRPTPSLSLTQSFLHPSSGTKVWGWGRFYLSSDAEELPPYCPRSSSGGHAEPANVATPSRASLPRFHAARDWVRHCHRWVSNSSIDASTITSTY